MNAPRHKLSAAERKRKSHMKVFTSMSEEELAGYKAAERERIRKAVQASRIEALRMKKKHAKEEAKALLKMTKTPPNPYKSRQSFSKAVNRLKSDLPESPRKQAAVIAKLAGEYGCSFENNKQVKSEIKEVIETFFRRTDIVYTMPGKGDEITIWTDEGRKRVRK